MARASSAASPSVSMRNQVLGGASHTYCIDTLLTTDLSLPPRRRLSAKFCPRQGLLWLRRGYSGSAATGDLGHGSRAARSDFQACKGAFMLHSRDRILTTHVGSLPRNAVLTDLLIRREAGEAI